ncbi:MAG: hypothetical protein HFH65_08800 [Lachnospiraceae bacterium]|nr:hypothetical protein [Lachnospiraceae bacterium]
MKKQKRTILSMFILLVILTVLAFINQYHLQKKNNDKEYASEQEGLFEKTIKSSGLDFVSIKETAEFEEVEYTVLSAECMTEVRKDQYYSQRDKIKSEIEFWSKPSDSVVIYPEELTYTYVTVELKNNSDTIKIFQKELMKLCNIEEKKMGKFFVMCDWKTWDKEGNISDWDFMLEPEESRKLEFFYVTFLPSSYHLYFTIDKQSPVPNSFVCLSLDLIQTEKKERDLALLKAKYGTTNYDLVNLQTKGSSILEQYFFDSEEKVGPYMEVEEEIYDSKKYTILNVELIDSYDKIPENFKNREYLQEMTNTYQKKYGFEKEQLQYLFITVRLEQFQNVKETIPVTVSQLMWLYNRKNDNTIWKIGYPDDYEVSEREDGEFIHMEEYQDAKGAVHYVTAAYVIWPDALKDVYLWTNDGPVRDGELNTYASASVREIGGGIHVVLPET